MARATRPAPFRVGRATAVQASIPGNVSRNTSAGMWTVCRLPTDALTSNGLHASTTNRLPGTAFASRPLCRQMDAPCVWNVTMIWFLHGAGGCPGIGHIGNVDDRRWTSRNLVEE